MATTGSWQEGKIESFLKLIVVIENSEMLKTRAEDEHWHSISHFRSA
jgi:hypothetical protein